jgi:16S rRNA (guanine966-N2)-methyltransferase
MRIISGNFKGKKILQPKDKLTRPLRDLAKESIFNVLNHSNKFNVKIKDSNIVDIFSGIGSFGLECLSRQASKVIFIENYLNVLPILKKNILSINGLNNSSIFEEDVYAEFDFKILDTKFEIIFLDPPFKQKKLPELLKKIHESNILSNNGVIIIHRHKNEKDNFPSFFKVLEEKSYGISKILFAKFS